MIIPNKLFEYQEPADPKEEIEALKKAYTQCREENRRLKEENSDKTPYALGCLIIIFAIFLIGILLIYYYHVKH